MKTTYTIIILLAILIFSCGGIEQSEHSHAIDSDDYFVYITKSPMAMLNIENEMEILLCKRLASNDQVAINQGLTDVQFDVVDGKIVGKFTPKQPGLIEFSGSLNADGNTYSFSDRIAVSNSTIVAVNEDLYRSLFVGKENTISVSIPGVPPTSIEEITTDNGIIKGSMGRYVVTPEIVGSCNIEVKYTCKGVKLDQTLEFSVVE
jgi:hypothetical protein